MENTFSKNLVLLRKEKGLSQKTVAADLNISQALLSHYEKGIRECGLSFVLKCADYFGVSCDFLLGHCIARVNNDNFFFAEIGSKEKSILDSMNIVFGISKKINNKLLTIQIINFFSAAVYTIVRTITKTNQHLFTMEERISTTIAENKMNFSKAKSLIVIEDHALELPELEGDLQSIRDIARITEGDV